MLAQLFATGSQSWQPLFVARSCRVEAIHSLLNIRCQAFTDYLNMQNPPHITMYSYTHAVTESCSVNSGCQLLGCVRIHRAQIR